MHAVARHPRSPVAEPRGEPAYTYALYLESDPRRQKTMVHVLDLLGCVAKGPTTEVALGATPDAIRAYLRFLARHGAPVDPFARFETRVEEHITDGQWLGNGDPALVFGLDRTPLTAEEAEIFIQRLGWSRTEMLALIAGQSTEQLAAQPPRLRSIRAMLEHVLESEHFYLSALGRIPDLPAAGSVLQKRQGSLIEWMAHVRAAEVAYLRALTPAERERPIVRWQQIWTARKAMRRMLEHEWEHLVELAERVGQPL